MDINPARPIMRYYGGKWKIANWILDFFPDHRCYVEPFGGAASVLMRKKPARIEIYNDLSDEMVNLFRVLRDQEQARQLREALRLTPYSRSEWLACYEFSDNPVEQARRTIVLASMSHNPSKVMNRQSNGFRTSSSGYHRLPQDFQNLEKNLELVSERLRDVIIEHRDAVSIIRQHDSQSTLHYVDPPYMASLRSDRRNLYQHEMFTPEAHQELAAVLRKAKGYVILSGYPCDEYQEWYEYYGWIPHSIQSVTSAAVKGKSQRTEVVWLNPKAAAAQRQLRAF